MSEIKFKIEKKIEGRLARAGLLETPHGVIETPAFAVVGTKATVKALTPDQLLDTGAQIFLANTYHLFLQPGSKLIKDAGGLHKFSGWKGPMITDSGGFQVFSLGVAYGKNITKMATEEDMKLLPEAKEEDLPKIAHIDADGVSFKSHTDGSMHYLTPEKSIEIQHDLGADIIFAFDECTSPKESLHYQKEALERTHRWAKRSLEHHKKLSLLPRLSASGPHPSAIFGVIQGGRFEDLRKESAAFFAELPFDGYGIGGSFVKEDVANSVRWVNEILPEDKPRHLLGIGEPEDIFDGVENGCDLFDCVAPTRNARNGALYTKEGRINILNSKFREDISPIDEGCECYTCKNFSKAYLAHLFRAKEILANTLASIHNVYFIVNLVKSVRRSILEENFDEFKKDFLEKYYKHS